jgi:uncharacterized protein YdiU (UPF0061 family)
VRGGYLVDFPDLILRPVNAFAMKKDELIDIGWRFDNSYARLPAPFFAPVKPSPVRSPKVTILNHRLADKLGLDLRQLSDEQAAGLFTGQWIPPGAEPIAQAYAGHQYGGFTMLGDGRAILLAEQLTPDGSRFDIQFKGSGPTPFSRRGDGLAALGPMLREYIVSEAMNALGIPTTRSLAVATTGDPVYRETTLPGAILTRVAASHIRVGTFQYAAAIEDENALRVLADYTIDRHYPELLAISNESLLPSPVLTGEGSGVRASAKPSNYLLFLEAVIQRQAELIACWQLVGFVHGVMNTDNMAISGETIDYGPCAFMDRYHPETVFSSIDEYGRYAYGNQPKIAQWNLARFAECLLAFIDSNQASAIEKATEAILSFSSRFETAWLSGMRKKLGLLIEENEDTELIQRFLDAMQESGADFTNTFRNLASEPLPDSEFFRSPAFVAWYQEWKARLRRNGRPISDAFDVMKSVNPFVIPRNHRVEEALAAATKGDLTVMEKLLKILSAPFRESPEFVTYREPPPSTACGYRTFCGT